MMLKGIIVGYDKATKAGDKTSLTFMRPTKKGLEVQCALTGKEAKLEQAKHLLANF